MTGNLRGFTRGGCGGVKVISPGEYSERLGTNPPWQTWAPLLDGFGYVFGYIAGIQSAGAAAPGGAEK